MRLRIAKLCHAFTILTASSCYDAHLPADFVAVRDEEPTFAVSSDEGPAPAVPAQPDADPCDGIVRTPSSAAGVAGSPERELGMTFGVYRPAAAPPEALTMYCHGTPEVARGVTSCDPYEGDTSCREARPILCIRAGNIPEPAGDIEWGYYAHWTGAALVSTTPHFGTELTSRSAASDICRAEFGEGFAMAEFHDGGGWGIPAYDCGIDRSARNWVAIDDQNANCWDGP